MNPSRIRWVNTVGIRYIKGTLKDSHYEKIIEGILNLNEEDIIAIDERTYENKFIFQVSHDEIYDKIIKDNLGRHLIVEPGKVIVEVEDISTPRTEVKIRDIPFPVTRRILRYYRNMEKLITYFIVTRPR